jgi:hypothetical protein
MAFLIENSAYIYRGSIIFLMARKIEIDMFDEGNAEAIPLLLHGQTAKTQLQQDVHAKMQMTLSGEPNEEIAFAA